MVSQVYVECMAVCTKAVFGHMVSPVCVECMAVCMKAVLVTWYPQCVLSVWQCVWKLSWLHGIPSVCWVYGSMYESCFGHMVSPLYVECMAVCTCVLPGSSVQYSWRVLHHTHVKVIIKGLQGAALTLLTQVYFIVILCAIIISVWIICQSQEGIYCTACGDTMWESQLWSLDLQCEFRKLTFTLNIEWS